MTTDTDSVTPRDDKDWTWVLERPCQECGLDVSTLSRPEVADLIEANVAAWSTVLARPDVRQRPRPDVWSPLEYACHVRDVFELFDQRLTWMLTEDDPQFANWNQDETAVAERYGEQDPVVVGTELHDAGQTLVASLRAVGDDQAARTGRRSDGAAFTVTTFARYLAHDPMHHLWDVER